MSVIPALRQEEQEDHKFQVSEDNLEDLVKEKERKGKRQSEGETKIKNKKSTIKSNFHKLKKQHPFIYNGCINLKF